MRTTRNCPRCGGHSWLQAAYDEQAGDCLVWRCLCGAEELFWSEYGGRHVVADRTHTILRGTLMIKALDTMVEKVGHVLSTADVATLMGVDSKVASYALARLERKGMVEVVEERRGIKGGSTWTLNPQLLGVFQMLVLGMSLREDNSKIWFKGPKFGEVCAKLVDIQNDTTFTLELETVDLIRRFQIVESSDTVILPEVKVHAGVNPNEGSVKICITAPKHIQIDRDKVRKSKLAQGQQ